VANPGEIVIGPETARLLDGGLDLVPLGAIAVKGRTQPVDAFRVRGT
jgi:class 3 adenylate cyclase